MCAQELISQKVAEPSANRCSGDTEKTDNLLYILELEETRSQLELARNKLLAIESSTSWRLTAAMRRTLARRPRLAQLLRRSIKFAWWTVTGQISQRLRSFNENRRMRSALAFSVPEGAVLSDLESAVLSPPEGAAASIPEAGAPPAPEGAAVCTSEDVAESTGAKFHPPYAPKVSVLVPFARSEKLPIHFDLLWDLPYDWEIIFLQNGEDRWLQDVRVRYLDGPDSGDLVDNIDKMVGYAFGQFIVLAGNFDFALTMQGLKRLKSGEQLVVLSSDGEVTELTPWKWRSGAIALMETEYWTICRDRLHLDRSETIDRGAGS